MKVRLFIFGVFFALLSFQAHAGRVHHKKKEADCTQYSGASADLSDADAKFLAGSVSIFRDKKRDELLSLIDDKAQLIRRFGFGVSARGGNLRFILKPEQIDADFNIHAPPMALPDYMGNGEVQHTAQLLREFASFAPSVTGQAVFLNRKVCDGEGECDIVPEYGGVEKMIGGLLYCSNHRSKVFVFTDGILLLEMENTPGAGLDTGEALFFSNTPTGRKLSALISFQ